MSKRSVYTNLIIGFACIVIIGMIVGFFRLRQDPVAQVTPSAGAASSRKLLFSDEFDGNTLAQRKWNTCYDNYSVDYKGCSNHGNQESQWYQASQVSVADGNLVLTSKKQQTNGVDGNGQYKSYDYISGMVSSGRYQKDTPEKWSHTYGLYEAKIKVPKGQAIWPAFWLLPISTEWPPEIDIMEVLGNKPNELLATYFWKDANNNAAKDSLLHNAKVSLADDWHIYAVDWQPDSLDWYLDGKRIKHVESENVSKVPMQIILNLAVGGQLPGSPDATTPETVTMSVDYVRVYE